MNDIRAGMFITFILCAVGLSLALLCFDGGRNSVVKDCQKVGVAIVNDTIIDCKVRE